MSILDDAIREHLELKRAHGADDDELRRLEDEAFGPPQRPDEIDPFAEAPTEFLLSPGETAAEAPEIADEHERSGRRPDIADLQEPPPAGEAPADLPPPAVEEHPAGEHEIVADPGPDTEERRAIAAQPTQMFDVEAQMDEPEDVAEPEVAAEPKVEAEAEAAAEAEVAAPEPEAEEDSAESDFFDEQRLSEELDQALEAPVGDEAALPEYEDGAAEGGVFDFEAKREPAAEPPAAEAEADDEHDYDPETGHDDVLEDTPRFLEGQPEDDDLWFEQKPPKDFDLD